jgi:hypothetical protein
MKHKEITGIVANSLNGKTEQKARGNEGTLFI